MDVRGHGYRCACDPCKAYRRDGSNYLARVARDYAFALARAQRRAPASPARVVRAQAWTDACAQDHAIHCECQDALKTRQEAQETAFSAPVHYWDVENESAFLKACRAMGYVK